MINQIVLVGRLAQTPQLHLTESGKKKSEVTLAVPRSYKNIDGEYETDFVDCVLWTNVAESTSEYCKVGDVIGVKGRIQTRMVTKDDGTKYKKTEIIAERVTFLSSKSPQSEVLDEDNSDLIIEDVNEKKCKKNGKNIKNEN